MNALIDTIKWLLFGSKPAAITTHSETGEIVSVVYVKTCNSRFSTPMYLYGEEQMKASELAELLMQRVATHGDFECMVEVFDDSYGSGIESLDEIQILYSDPDPIYLLKS